VTSAARSLRKRVNVNKSHDSGGTLSNVRSNFSVCRMIHLPKKSKQVSPLSWLLIFLPFSVGFSLRSSPTANICRSFATCNRFAVSLKRCFLPISCYFHVNKSSEFFYKINTLAPSCGCLADARSLAHTIIAPNSKKVSPKNNGVKSSTHYNGVESSKKH